MCKCSRKRKVWKRGQKKKRKEKENTHTHTHTHTHVLSFTIYARVGGREISKYQKSIYFVLKVKASLKSDVVKQGLLFFCTTLQKPSANDSETKSHWYYHLWILM
jgi:hypothetical protein